ncbi:MAG: hypothetical protein JWN76_2381 [Chitinophagaceae bacterium]|nr:hypothetical protein [Chitinophagaceae bacterium]
MKRIHTYTRCQCLGQYFDFDVSLLVDTHSGYFRFRFMSRDEQLSKLPFAATHFHIVTTFHKRVVFNSLAFSQNAIEQSLKQCVDHYIKHFTHPDLADLDGNQG